MGMRPIKAGSTSQSVTIQIFNINTGAGLTGLVYNTAGLTCYYNVQAGSSTSVTLATLAAANSAYSSGGFKEIDATNKPGSYRLDIPNAAISATGEVNFVLQGASNMAPCSFTIPLVAYDPYDTVRLGLTAMPNVAAGASGGLPLSVDASGRVDVLKINGTSQTARDIGASVLLSPGTGTGQISLTSGAVTVGTNNDKTGYALTQTFPTNFSSMAITAGGAVTAGTVSDKTGYSLTQTFPTNFSSLAITVGGAVTAGTVSDKTGYSLSGTQTFNVTGNITGNLSGSVGSVTGAVGSVTGAVGSVTGNVGGNVVGSVASVTGNVGGNVVGSVASVTAAVTVDGTSPLTEAYASLGGALTLSKALYGINQQLGQMSISGTTMTVKKRDGTTTAKTFTLDSSSSPTSITEAS